jgi:predicted DNA-binding transcriptional regulator YafY
VPRNQQMIRQWHVLRRLEGSGATLEEVARSLPGDYSRHHRTVRRDLAALEAAGFPIVTESAGGRTRWRLMDGFRRIPALGFAPTELMALVLGGELLKPLEGTHVHAALGSALAKVSAALPPSGAAFVKEMGRFLSVSLGPHKTYRERPETVDALSRAIAEHRTVQMRYFTAARGRTSRREVDPYHLWYAGGGLYLIAHDHRRREVRTFAVERIRSLTLTDHPYQLPLGFDLDAYVKDALVVMRGTPTTVELVFDRATAAWARDRVWHPSQRLTPLRDGRLRMTLEVADTREVLGWILSFGSGVRVVGPRALQARVAEEAAKIAHAAGGARAAGDQARIARAATAQVASAEAASAQVITVRPSLRKSSSKARQGMWSRRVVTTTKEIASQNARR